MSRPFFRHCLWAARPAAPGLVRCCFAGAVGGLQPVPLRMAAPRPISPPPIWLPAGRCLERLAGLGQKRGQLGPSERAFESFSLLCAGPACWRAAGVDAPLAIAAPGCYPLLRFAYIGAYVGNVPPSRASAAVESALQRRALRRGVESGGAG